MATDQSNQTLNVPTQPSEPVTARLRYREAYQRVLADQIAVDPAKLLVINIDVPSTYTTVIGALGRIKSFRERASQLKEFDVKNFDNLETYALALMHVQGEYVSASSPPEAIVALNEEGTALRDTLYSDALALVNRGLVNGEPLKDFKTATGYKNLAEDLVGLSSLLRRSWDKIGARTMVTMAELDQAEDVSERLLHAVAVRENASDVLADAIQKRLQVFTLLVNAYDQVRRAISFLRWTEEDIEEIAPSLYAGRTRKKADPEQPVVTPTTPGGAGQTTAPAGTQPSAPVGAAGSGAPPAAGTSGIPQGNPFAPRAVS
ncbi:MAG TPA: hypothetical protein VER96_26715 [Polyangiaceae bacterium]|nr:hypothetical protein [Polyangiaceae bacterium]